MRNQKRSFLKKFAWLGYLVALGASGWAGAAFFEHQTKLKHPTPQETLMRLLSTEMER